LRYTADFQCPVRILLYNLTYFRKIFFNLTHFHYTQKGQNIQSDLFSLHAKQINIQSDPLSFRVTVSFVYSSPSAVPHLLALTVITNMSATTDSDCPLRKGQLFNDFMLALDDWPVQANFSHRTKKNNPLALSKVSSLFSANRY